ncbi:unnamed protein product [Mycena citricolor]|uniref:Spindle pole body component n=1 Tax=Mycena citricolor TaxID=2018698 RepID=A0AAD2K632_9AGAR|nr:unnamed protein product [Mycena citricolor]
MQPFTPGTRNGARKKNISLSAKEYTKAGQTLIVLGQFINFGVDYWHYRVTRNGHSSRESRARGRDEPSFIAETSFVRAPLNSRVSSSSAMPKIKGKAKQEPLQNVSVDIQEALILEDMLYILMGIEGTYITFHEDYSAEDDDPLQGIRFVVSPSLDTSLRDLVERILPLGTYYTAILAFVEQRSHLDFGLVNHALCAAIRDMLKDYQTLLSQLEHAFTTSAQFSLQKLWFYIHPTIHTLSLIYQLVLELGTADDPSGDLDSSSTSSIDPEEEARNEALGLGGAGLRAVLSEMDKNGLDVTGGSGIPVKGGEVLAIIYERMQNMSGDPTAHALHSTLLSAAGVPYVSMLRTWITTGRLVDPYEELLVKESKFINRGILEMDYTDEYWERRYTLRDGSTLAGLSKRRQAGVPLPRTVNGRLPGGACVPPLLEGWKHKILLAGKYLNVIRECGMEIRRADDYASDASLDDEKFYAFIEDAYTHANQTLLQLLLRDQQLIPRLSSLKRYFFLSQSSLLTHLLDLSHTELRKTAKSASIVKLQSLLDLALNTDSHGEDQLFREDVKVTMAPSGLYEWLLNVVNVSGVIGGEDGEPETHHEEQKKEKDDKKPMLAIDALALDYTVKFPLSLVISRKTILRYQLLFRFLLHLKHVEQSLTAMWTEHKTHPWRVPVPHHPELERWRLRVFLLRARMLSFVQQILAFSTFEVLEPNWRVLEGKLARVTTVDQLLRDHVDFLDTCLKECMLTSSKLLRAYSRLIVTCSTFALYTSSFTKSAGQAITASETSEGDQAMAKRWDFLGKFETNFNHWFKCFLHATNVEAAHFAHSSSSLFPRSNFSSESSSRSPGFPHREGVRNALLRVKNDQNPGNLSFFPIAVGLPLSCITSAGYSYIASAETKAQSGFYGALGLYAFAAVLELWCEPMHNRAMVEMKTHIRVRAEGAGVMFKTLITFLVLFCDSRFVLDGKLALAAFALGQLAYALTLLVVYVGHFGIAALFPQPKNGNSPPADNEIFRVSLTMTSQSVIKHFLTEGDKLVLGYFSPLRDQGGYAVAVNYGSLIARMVFQPIEETSRITFSRMLAPPPSQEALREAADSLLNLLSLQMAFSFILLIFGPAYMPVLLPVLLPRQYLLTSAPRVLGAWIWYIPVLALNGGLEAFISSVSTPKDLNRQSWWMAIFSFIYIASAVELYSLGFGDASLVFANILNLGARIAYATHFITGYFTAHQARSSLHWQSVLPHWKFSMACCVSWAAIRESATILNVRTIVAHTGSGAGVRLLIHKSILIHIGIGGAMGCACLGTWWYTQGRQLLRLKIKKE